jgi:hypothetical protein
MRAQGLRNHGLLVAVLLLGLPAVAGCGSSEEEPRVQRVAYCQGPSTDGSDNGFLDVEFRQGSTVVAQGSVSAGLVLSAEVPWGPVQIYVDGVQTGEVNEGVDLDTYRSPGPDDVTYISGPGCPDKASP